MIRIALAGNPNSGKTTLFNALTGSNQFVGNWPGVTVEKKEGRLKQNKEVLIADLPGIYSLSPYTMEEKPKSKFVMIIVGLIILLLIFLIGYIVVTQYINPNDEEQNAITYLGN